MQDWPGKAEKSSELYVIAFGRFVIEDLHADIADDPIGGIRLEELCENFP